MATPRMPLGATADQIRSWAMELLVDEMLATYVDWRQAAWAVGEAYGHWSDASAPERSVRHAAYIAALDREESAALGYAAAVADVALAIADDVGADTSETPR